MLQSLSSMCAIHTVYLQKICMRISFVNGELHFYQVIILGHYAGGTRYLEDPILGFWNSKSHF